MSNPKLGFFFVGIVDNDGLDGKNIRKKFYQIK